MPSVKVKTKDITKDLDYPISVIILGPETSSVKVLDSTGNQIGRIKSINIDIDNVLIKVKQNITDYQGD